MKKLPFLTLMLAACALMFVASCKKDDSPEDLLAGTGCWKTVKSEYRDAGTTTWTNEPVEPCLADDCTSFKSGAISFDEGATKCDPTDPQSSTGTYTLSEDGKTLTITQDGFTFPFTVEELSSKKLVLTVSFLGETRTTFEAQ